MSKIKTHERSFSIGRGWSSVCYYKEGYYKGLIYTPKGIIDIYISPKPDIGRGNFYAKASILHKGRYYHLKTYAELTKLGWIRIAKKWARKILSQ